MDPDPGVPAVRRPVLRAAFIAVTLFFTIGPLLNVLQHRPEPAPFALLLLGWAAFAGVVVQLFRHASPFGRSEDARFLVGAWLVLIVTAFVTQVVFEASEAIVLYYYAGVTAARFTRQSWSMAAIGVVALLAAVGTIAAGGDPADGLSVGVTVGTISLTLSALSAQGRTNRALHAARLELADAAVANERARIARDLHDTLGHSLSLMALKSELARRVVRADPDRAALEIEDVEHAAREALAAVRETISGYRQPTLAMELAGAREAFRTAGIDALVEPPPEALPREVDALLAWAVREGVTNVLRHSDARSAGIRVRAAPDAVSVEIVDDGRTRNGDTASDPGTGIAGLRERAATLGAAVVAGPRARGGFRLAVTVPVEPAP